MGGYTLATRIRHLPSKILLPLLSRISRRGLRPHAGRALFFPPALVLLVLLVIYPVLQTIFLGFYLELPGGQRQFTGLDNYRAVLTDPATINVGNLPWPPPLGTLIHNALWIVIHLPISLFAGLWLALLLQETKGASVVKSCIFLGMVTPMIVGVVILRFLLEAAGAGVASLSRLGSGGLLRPARNFGCGVGPDTLALHVYRVVIYDPNAGKAAGVASLLPLLTLRSTSLIIRRMAKS